MNNMIITLGVILMALMTWIGTHKTPSTKHSNTSPQVAAQVANTPPPQPEKQKPTEVGTHPTHQLCQTIWHKTHPDYIGRESIWVSAYRPQTQVMTLLHEYVKGEGSRGSADRGWATYDISPGETIYIAGAVGSSTKIKITSQTTSAEIVSVTAEEVK